MQFSYILQEHRTIFYGVQMLKKCVSWVSLWNMLGILLHTVRAYWLGSDEGCIS